MKNIQVQVQCNNYSIDRAYFETLEEAKEFIKNFGLDDVEEETLEFVTSDQLLFVVYDTLVKEENLLYYELKYI